MKKITESSNSKLFRLMNDVDYALNNLAKNIDKYEEDYGVELTGEVILRVYNGNSDATVNEKKEKVFLKE